MKRNRFGINLDEGIPLSSERDFELLYVTCFNDVSTQLHEWIERGDKPLMLGGQIGSGKSTLIHYVFDDNIQKPDVEIHFDKDTLNKDAGDFWGITLAEFIKEALKHHIELSFSKLPEELGGYQPDDWNSLSNGLCPREFSMEIFNIKKVDDANYAISASFEHSGYFLQKVNRTLNTTLENLFCENRQQLRLTKRESTTIQNWANIIIANIFKTLRLLDRKDIIHTQEYAQTINALQEIAEGMRDVIMRSYNHIANNHKGLLKIQVDELTHVKSAICDLLEKTSNALLKKEIVDYDLVDCTYQELKKMAREFDKNQVLRIQDDSSKTRLSILFYGLMVDSLKIAERTLSLLKIFQESFKFNEINK